MANTLTRGIRTVGSRPVGRAAQDERPEENEDRWRSQVSQRLLMQEQRIESLELTVQMLTRRLDEGGIP